VGKTLAHPMVTRDVLPDARVVLQNVRVLTVDDHESFRRAARDLIRGTPGFESVGEACCGLDAIEMVAGTSPQLVLMDVRMPGITGVETARRMGAEHPDVVVVLVSTDDPQDLATAAHGCGAAALVAKRDLSSRKLAQLWNSVGGGSS
jgi:DNA-binding NarL/FixJ family response regulator